MNRLLVGLALVTGWGCRPGPAPATRWVALGRAVQDTTSPASDTVYALAVLHGVCVVAESLDTVLPGRVLLAQAIVAPSTRCAMIRYDPRAMATLPSPVALFVLLHEYGHLVLRHQPSTEPLAVHQAAERAADCVAARLLRERWPRLVPAVMAWYMGQPQPDPEHDAGLDVAARIARCAVGGPP